MIDRRLDLRRFIKSQQMALLSALVSLTAEQRNKLGELANKFKPTHSSESCLSEEFNIVGNHGFNRAKKEPHTAVDRRI